MQHKPDLATEFIDYLIKVYDDVPPYSSPQDRASRPIMSATPQVIDRYNPLNAYGEYSVEFTLHIVEVMATTEKTSNTSAYMFKNVLTRCRNGTDIFGIVSAASYSGR